jgi:hypothetical protein
MSYGRKIVLHWPVHPSDNNPKAEPLDEMQTPSTMTTHKKIATEQAEDLALRTLAYIADDDERLGRFLDTTGLRPETIRTAATSPGFLAAVLDYVAADEPLLVSLAQALDLKPERIMEARWTLSPSEFE